MSKCKPTTGASLRELKESQVALIDATEIIAGEIQRFVYIRIPYEELRDNKEVIKAFQGIVEIASIEDDKSEEK